MQELWSGNRSWRRNVELNKVSTKTEAVNTDGVRNENDDTRGTLKIIIQY